MKNQTKTNPLKKMVESSIITLPTPVNISIWWNLGSMLGMCLLIQLMSGVFLSMHYCPNTTMAFESIINIIKNVNNGWVIRNMHVNGASMFFMLMYLHIARGIYYHSFKLKMTWAVGVMIMLLSMSTAFMGYILPWGQMSYWGATVITNLMSTIPLIGQNVVEWLWGGFSVSNPTLNRFFSLHFLLPFIIVALVMVHLLFLHQTGSNNPMGLNSNYYKLPFNPYFTLKDTLGFVAVASILTWVIICFPYLLSDPDNFNQANPMITPTHIQPEWYFLFAYAILRSIPSKLGGVMALTMSICILLTMPFMKSKYSSNTFYPLMKFQFWLFIMTVIMLTWLGAQPIEFPFVNLSQIYSSVYFSFFISFKMTLMTSDFVNFNLIQ